MATQHMNANICRVETMPVLHLWGNSNTPKKIKLSCGVDKKLLFILNHNFNKQTTKSNLVDKGPFDVISKALIPYDGIVQWDACYDNRSGNQDWGKFNWPGINVQTFFLFHWWQCNTSKNTCPAQFFFRLVCCEYRQEPSPVIGHCKFLSGLHRPYF